MPGTGYGVSIISSGDKYCDIDDVKQFLPPNIITEGTVANPDPLDPAGATETLQNNDIEYFIDQACTRIDAALSSIFDVPLKKINQGGLVDWPSPVRMVAALLSSQMIFEQRLQGVDRTRSESQKEREKWAEGELLLIQNGERRLVGQRNTRGNRFVRGTLPNIPRNPAPEGTSKGNSS